MPAKKYLKPINLPIIDSQNISQEHFDFVIKHYWDVPDDLDHSGIYEAKQGYAYAVRFLLSLQDNKATFSAAVSEIEKLLQWCYRIKGKAPHVLGHLELEEYLDFATNPPERYISKSPQKRFISDGGGKRIPNPNWRPFSKPKKSSGNKTVEKGFRLINKFFKGLQTEFHDIKTNPCAHVSRERFAQMEGQKSGQKNELKGKDITLIQEVMNAMVRIDKKYTRERFVFSLMFNLKLKESDLSEVNGRIPLMSDFYHKRSSGWWFVLFTRHESKADEPVSDYVMSSLVAYRLFLGLPEYPLLFEDTPLICRFDKPGEPIKSKRQISDIVDLILSNTVKKASELGWNNKDISRLKSFRIY